MFQLQSSHNQAVYVRSIRGSYIQSVTGRTDQTSGECSLGQTIPIKPKTPISKVKRLQRYWPEKRVDFFGVCVLYSFP
jgi:hypothetical protein